MARVKPHQPLLPSVLNRLLDDEPDEPQDPPGRRHQLKDLKEDVRRDLEDLLNTRARCSPCPEAFKELKETLLTYGLPDFVGGGPGAEATARLPVLLEEIIRRHEPRFAAVTVVLPDAAEPLDRVLHFRIEAQLRAEPVPEPVVFDSTLKAATGTFEVRGEDD